MRLKTFQAETMTEAMDLVRQTLGDEAIIVSTYTHRNLIGSTKPLAMKAARQLTIAMLLVVVITALYGGIYMIVDPSGTSLHLPPSTRVPFLFIHKTFLWTTFEKLYCTGAILGV
ncbi:hypothetical protein [Bdellovibrio bacteriovorus]|uniref:Uncharacterized protein n=1 Tax=Bdellovibrio bacteriovorus TaxID=959 RepID=A0A1Z3NCY6_BDEBC|nr:hypothetical protein [Bdellovibrio bacteriovorus]ASD65339.1 hypothetical protein B9G79_18080 [Bdellovibrio bacteriovorus]